MASSKYMRTVSAGRFQKQTISYRPLPNDTTRARAAKTAHTGTAQAFINGKNCADKLETVLWANFDSKAACFVSFTYSPQTVPKTRKLAKNNMVKYFRVLRGVFSKLGRTAVYLYTTEGKAGEDAAPENDTWELQPWKARERWANIPSKAAGKEMPVRLHHHAIMLLEKTDYETIRALWPHGRVYIQPIKTGDMESFQRLAYYMTKEYRAGKTTTGEKSYCASTKLIQPLVRGEWVSEGMDIAAPDNAKVLSELRESNLYSSFHALCYLLPRTDAQPEEYRRKSKKTPHKAPK